MALDYSALLQFNINVRLSWIFSVEVAFLLIFPIYVQSGSKPFLNDYSGFFSLWGSVSATVIAHLWFAVVADRRADASGEMQKEGRSRTFVVEVRWSESPEKGWDKCPLQLLLPGMNGQNCKCSLPIMWMLTCKKGCPLLIDRFVLLLQNISAEIELKNPVTRLHSDYLIKSCWLRFAWLPTMGLILKREHGGYFEETFSHGSDTHLKQNI